MNYLLQILSSFASLRNVKNTKELYLQNFISTFIPCPLADSDLKRSTSVISLREMKHQSNKLFFVAITIYPAAPHFNCSKTPIYFKFRAEHQPLFPI